VLSRLDESMLQQIALPTGGSYRRATSGGNEIEDIFKELSTLQKTEMGSLQVTGFEDQFYYPLLLAILLLIVEDLLSERRGKILLRMMKLVPVGRILPLFLLFAVSFTHAQTVRSHVKSGNEAYEKNKFADAEAEYKKALQLDPTSREAQFDLGNAYYKQQRFDEAQRSYNASITTAKKPVDQSMACYNLGNGLFRSNKIPECLEAYKQGLRLNPGDEDARYNYQLAKDRLKQQNQQQSDQNKQRDQQQQQPQPQQSKQDKLNQQQSQAQQQKNQMPKEQADRILDAMRNNEKELQKQLRKRQAARVYIEKDW
jgi:tetratricopeptide (TPR) repeat protein